MQKKQKIFRKPSFFLALLMIIILFSFIAFIQSSFTGFQIQNEHNQTILRKEASAAIATAEQIIENMKGYNFTLIFVNDTLIAAKRAYQQAYYDEILRNSSAPQELRREAQQALQLVDRRNISYSNVLVYTKIIMQRREQAFLIYDFLNALQKDIENYKKQPQAANITSVEQLYAEAVVAFENDRYEEANSAIATAKQNFDAIKSESATLRALREQAKTYIELYWPYLLVMLLILIIVAVVIINLANKQLLKRKIQKMRGEQRALTNLIKKAQEEHFREQSIPALIYNIRIKKYNARLTKIKEQLPVLEEKLKQRQDIIED
jgi:hypothetical protein